MPYDDTEFVDRGFPPAPVPASGNRPLSHRSGRAPTREELDAQVTETQQQLARLIENQQQLERVKAELEVLRQRRAEFQVGRTEVRDQITRAVGLLEKAEFSARRDAEQMAKSLTGLREAMARVDDIHDESWTQENWAVEVGRALTAIENGRLEVNAARIKWPILDGKGPGPDVNPVQQGTPWTDLGFWKLFQVGLALTWPLLLIGTGLLAALLLILFRPPL